MTNKPPFDRSFFVPRIFIQIGGGLFIPPHHDEILPLGSDYEATMAQLLETRSKIFKDIGRHLKKMSDKDLQLAYSADGTAAGEAEKEWVFHRRREIDAAFSRLPLWYTAALFRTDDLANFEHWSRSAFLTLDEVVWLSVGLEPEKAFKDLVSSSAGPSPRIGKRPSRVAKYMRRHKEQIRREFDPHNYNPDLLPAPLLDWIERVIFPVHPKFVEMLRYMAGSKSMAVNSRVPIPAAVEAQPGPMDGRERASLAKLITAMAIDGYGFDPTQKRSPIPNEITALTERLGIQVSKDTIRKYLKLGSENLPEGWNDD